jgi:hypothetical protein
MSKREEYGLLFNKVRIDNGELLNTVSQRTPGGKNSVLLFIRRLDVVDCRSFIYDLNGCIASEANIDDCYCSDTVEDMVIQYWYPNVNVDDVLIIPMTDMRGLLQEWLEFISTSLM